MSDDVLPWLLESQISMQVDGCNKRCCYSNTTDIVYWGWIPPQSIKTIWSKFPVLTILVLQILSILSNTVWFENAKTALKILFCKKKKKKCFPHWKIHIFPKHHASDKNTTYKKWIIKINITISTSRTADGAMSHFKQAGRPCCRVRLQPYFCPTTAIMILSVCFQTRWNPIR